MSGEGTDTDVALQLGYELHQQAGRESEAEDAYRRAIAGGRSDAWLYLGALLSWQRGRESDAVAAFHAAMDAETPELRSRAALELAENMDRSHNDGEHARAYYERALQSVTGRGRIRALFGLAY